VNTEYKVIQANKNAIDALKWVNKASHKKNPEQMCIYVRGLTVAAMNGFQIHVMIPQIDNPFPEGTWIVRGIAGDLVTLEKVNVFEPDWRATIETFDNSTSQGYAGKVVVSTTVWPALLANSLSLGSLVTRMSMTLRGHVVVLEGWLDDEIQLRAYTMLMRVEGDQAVLIAPPEVGP
jgi:hypothetical protein